MAIKHPHSGNDALLLDQRDMVGHGQKVVQNRRDRAPAGDSIGDRLDAVGLDDRFRPPRQRHRRRAPRLHANDLDLRGEALEDITDAGRHGAAPERKNHRVYRTHVLDELDPNRPGAFAGVEVFAVLDQKRAFDCRRFAAPEGERPQCRRRQSAPSRPRRECAPASRGWRWRRPRPSRKSRGFVRYRPAPAQGCRRSHRRPTWSRAVGQPRHDRLRTAGLEASHRIGGFEFENELAIQRLAESRARELGRVAEDWRDFWDRGANPV